MARRLCLTRLLLLSTLLAPPSAWAFATILVSAAPYNAACNGTSNDATAIQNAINALPADGGILQFPNTNLCGVGSAGVAVTQRKSVTFQGLGPNAGLRALAAGPAFGGYGATMLSFSNCYGCRITGMAFNGNALTTNLVGIKDSVGVRVDQNTFTNAGHNGAVVTSGNTNNVYERNTISGMLSLSRGLWIGNQSATELEYNAEVLDNTITLTSATAIVCVFRGGSIRGNTLTGTGGGSGSGMALSAANGIRCENVMIQGNTVIGWNFQGIQSDAIDDTQYSQNITIAGNTIRQNLNSGVYVVRARNWVVIDNTIEDNNFDAAGAGSGIYVGTAKQILVQGNRVTDTRTGASRTQTTGIRVVANVGVRDTEDITIAKNVVTNTNGDGIQLTNAAPGTMERVLMLQNLSTDNNGWGIAVLDVVDGDIKKVTATGNSTARNVSGDIRMDPSDGVIN